MAQKKRTRRRMSWDEWYRLAKEYRDSHGDLLVPRGYVAPGGEKLGRWIERQRAIHNGTPSNKSYLYPEQIRLLDEIGMVWRLEWRHAWADWLKMVRWYRDTYGDIVIPKDFSEGDYHLGNWMLEQRQRRVAGLLTEGQIADLDALGMVWNVKLLPRPWDEWYADARRYYEAHGDLRVPAAHTTPEGYDLGYWVYKQRRIYLGEIRGKALTPEQIDQLNAIDMVWDKRESAWNQMYGWVSAYRAENGRLPTQANNLRTPDGRSAAAWITVQRAAMAAGRLSPDKREKLRELGIVAAKSKPAAGEGAGE